MKKRTVKKRTITNRILRLLSDVICPIALLIYECFMTSPSLTSLFSTAIILHGRYKFSASFSYVLQTCRKFRPIELLVQDFRVERSKDTKSRD